MTMTWLRPLSVTLLASSLVSAASLPCSLKAKKGDEPKRLAKISQDVAQKAALATFQPADRTTVAEAELEIERGCVVYSFDIKVAEKSGVEEVLVDAGDGKVLSREHESPKKEAAEVAKERK